MQPDSKLLADALRTHFVCRGDAYALQNSDGSYTAVRQSLTDKLLLQHCQGTRTISTYLVNNLGNTKLCLLDIDATTDQARGFILWAKRWLAHFKIPCFIEDSGRRGYHLWVLFKVWVPAAKANQLLLATLEAYEDIGELRRHIEVFPPPGKPPDLGKCAKLPWGKHQVTGKFCPLLDDDFKPLADWGLEQLAPTEPITEMALDDILMELPKPRGIGEGEAPVRGTGLPCFAQMLEGVDEGFRHIASFRLAIHLYRQGLPSDLARVTLLKWDLERNHPPLGEKQIGYNVRDAYTGKYKLGCPNIEAAGFCNPTCPIWKKRREELDPRCAQEVPGSVIESITKVTSEPPFYTVSVNSYKFNVTLDELYNMRSFKKLALAKINIIPHVGATQRDWEQMINQRLAGMQEEPAPQDATAAAGRLELIEDWLTNAPKAEAPEDVAAGRPVAKPGWIYFRVRDATAFLKARHHIFMERSELWALIRAAKGEQKVVRVGDKTFKLWGLPIEGAISQEEELVAGEISF